MYCGKCGKQLPKDSPFCAFCGAKLVPGAQAVKGRSAAERNEPQDAAPPSKQAVDVRKKGRRFLLALILLGVAAVAVAAVLVLPPMLKYVKEESASVPSPKSSSASPESSHSDQPDDMPVDDVPAPTPLNDQKASPADSIAIEIQPGIHEGNPMHEIVFNVEYGQKIELPNIGVQQLSQTYETIANATSIPIIAPDTLFIPEEPTKETPAEITVKLEANLIDSDGQKYPLDVPEFTVNVPQTELTLYQPATESVTLDQPILDIAGKAVPGATLIIDGKDASASIDELGNFRSVYYHENGERLITLEAKEPYHRPKTVTIKINDSKTPTASTAPPATADPAVISLFSLTPEVSNKWEPYLLNSIDAYGNWQAFTTSYLAVGHGNYAEYSVNGRYTRLSGRIVAHQNMNVEGSAMFVVIADEVAVYTSPVVTAGTEVFGFTADISGAQSIRTAVVGTSDTSNRWLLLLDLTLE